MRINKLRYVFIIWSLCLSSVSFSQQARGIVFLDMNENQLFDPGEKGIPGVAVSNGRDVVVTDEMGAYTISVSEQDVIFLIKPSGYRIPVNELNLPRFYYIYKPEGSPDFRYKGVAPTGYLPERIDFPLLPGECEEEFRVLVFGDPQPYSIQEVEFFERKIVRELENRTDFAFGMIMGDIVGDDLTLFEPLNCATARIGIPMHHVIGNHDINFDAPSPYFADETFMATYGPSTYAMNYGRVHFLVLNNIIYPNTDSFGRYIGGIRPDQFQFIENSLKLVPTDHVVVLLMHIHMFDVPGWGETFRRKDRELLFELLKDYPNNLSLSAHMHTQRHHFFNRSEGWLQEAPHHHFNVGTSSGNWWSGELDEDGLPDAMMQDGTPQGYSVLSFKGNEYLIDYFVSGSSEDHKMNIHAPLLVPQGRGFRGELYVNFFNGTETCSLTFRVNDGEWIDMRRVIEPDPTFYEVILRWDTTTEPLSGVRPSNPVNSMHLWKARVPSNLPPGEHVLEVKAVDMFGREFTASRIYTIFKKD